MWGHAEMSMTTHGSLAVCPRGFGGFCGILGGFCGIFGGFCGVLWCWCLSAYCPAPGNFPSQNLIKPGTVFTLWYLLNCHFSEKVDFEGINTKATWKTGNLVLLFHGKPCRYPGGDPSGDLSWLNSSDPRSCFWCLRCGAKNSAIPPRSLP